MPANIIELAYLCLLSYILKRRVPPRMITNQKFKVKMRNEIAHHDEMPTGVQNDTFICGRLTTPDLGSGLRAVNIATPSSPLPATLLALAMFHLNSDLYDAIDSSAFGKIPILPQRLGWTQMAYSVSWQSRSYPT